MEEEFFKVGDIVQLIGEYAPTQKIAKKKWKIIEIQEGGIIRVQELHGKSAILVTDICITLI